MKQREIKINIYLKSGCSVVQLWHSAYIAQHGMPKAFYIAITGLIAYLLGAVALDRAAVDRPEDMKLKREPSIVCSCI